MQSGPVEALSFGRAVDRTGHGVQASHPELWRPQALSGPLHPPAFRLYYVFKAEPPELLNDGYPAASATGGVTEKPSLGPQIK